MSKKEEQKPQGHSVNIPHSTEPPRSKGPSGKSKGCK